MPWIDLGQGYIQTKAYLEKHPAGPCWLLTDWQWDASMYDVPCGTYGYFILKRIPPRMNGTVIVSSTLLTSVREEQAHIVVPFKNAVPKDVIGGSALLVFAGDFHTSAAAGFDAVALAPTSAFAHLTRCVILANAAQPYAALAEYQASLRLAKDDPVNHSEFRSLHFDEQVEKLMGVIRIRGKLQTR